MIKFYEVAPEYREEPIDDFDYEPGYWLEKVSVTGNIDYRSHKSEAYKQAEWCLEYIEDEYDFHDIERQFGIVDCSALSKAILYKKEYKYRNEDVIVALLKALTGEEYDSREIHGCCQGDWNRVYYPVSMGDDFVEWFETAYFNEGSEWVVEDEDDRIKLYSCEWNEDKTKEDLADQYGVSVDECEFYKFNGWSREPDYKKI